MKLDWKKFQNEISISDINVALLTQTELFIVYAEHYSKAMRKRKEARWQLEKIEAILKDNIRNTVTDEKGKPLSDAEIVAVAMQSPDYISAKEAYIEAENDETDMGLIMKAIDMRKDMLRSLSANRREELANKAFALEETEEYGRMQNALMDISSKLGIGQPSEVTVIKGQNSN